MTNALDRSDIIEAASLIRWARDAEDFYRRRGQYVQAVAFQQIADAVELRGAVLDCEFVYHEAVHDKFIKNRDGEPL